ncbi:MAG: cytochrome c3 family protein [Burkholderiales bacterium]
MKLLVITQSRNRAGRTVQVRKDVTADWVRVGRNAASEVLLADPRIALSQGLIVDRNGPVYTEGEMGTMTSTTRKAVRAVRLSPGTTLDIGPYKVSALVPPPGYTGAITVELVRPAENVAGEFLTRAARLTLASLRLPKRGVALALFALVAIAFFLLPAARVLDLPWRQPEGVAMASDRFWNPGPVLLAHQPVELKCEACHQVAFRQVLDAACLECHARIGHHVAPAMKPAALFEGRRCAECHRDHKGVKATHRDDDRFCADCHRDIRSRANGAQSQDVSDFAKDHPAFRLSLPSDAGARRVRQGGAPIEEASGLVFPHATHLDPAGVKHPGKGRVVLDCQACHHADASRRGFVPVAMKRDCQACHRLAFEPAMGEREVPHGSPREAITVVREFYANLALNGTEDSFEKAFGVPGSGLLRRPGVPSEEARRAALALAGERAERATRELFGSRLAASGRKSEQVSEELFQVRVCSACHEIAEREGPEGTRWEVAPVRQVSRWMPNARFDHASHAQSKCADCHDVARSKKSADVAMPRIEGCRECHGGSRPVERKVTSNCLLCHGFHEQKHPWDPRFVPKAGARVAKGPAVAN